MNFFRRNTLFLSILGAFIVLLGLGIFALVQKIRERQTVHGDLLNKMAQLNELLNRKPFPSNENVNQIRKHAEEEEAIVARALKTLRLGTVSFSRMAGSQCKAVILDASRRMADQLNSHDVLFPNRFQFGFQRYDVRPPDNEDTPMVQKQLKAVEELIRLVADARFHEILSIRRLEFEDLPRDSAGPKANPSAEPLISLGGRFEHVDLPGYIYTLIPFELELKGNTESLIKFLNELARSPHVFIPRILNIENEKKEPITGKDIATSTETARTGPSTAPPDQAGDKTAKYSGFMMVDPAKLPFVLGQEKIKIGMRIDWLEFRAK